MEFGIDVERETLQSLVKSCLLELNNLKMHLTELEMEKTQDNTVDKIQELENHILEKEKEVSLIKYKAEEEINLLNSKLNDKDETIKKQENKIYELDYVNNSLDEIKVYFAEQLKDFKRDELADINKRLNESLKSVAEKDAYINTLSKKIDEYKIELIKLESNIDNKNNIISLKKELELRKEEIYKKDNELNLLKEKSISIDDYFKLQQELSKKEDKIKRLEEINEFFTELKKENDAFAIRESYPPEHYPRPRLNKRE